MNVVACYRWGLFLLALSKSIAREEGLLTSLVSFFSMYAGNNTFSVDGKSSESLDGPSDCVGGTLFPLPSLHSFSL